VRLLVTGGAGFIGSNFVHHWLRAHPADELVVVDKLTYAGNLLNLETALASGRVRFERRDIADPALAEIARGCDVVVHFAAESHVDRSIEDAAPFVRTNVEGTWRLVDACRQAKVGRFIHVSTDEVYGSCVTGKFREDSPLAPTSPYAASKAAADLLVLSAVKTHGFPAVITRCTNNYGPYQFPEKFIPLMIAQALANDRLPIYGDGKNVRDWIYVADHCQALEAVLQRGREGEVYNIGGGCELENIAVARDILRHLDKSEKLLNFVADRPAHDRRYALDCTKVSRELGWRPQRNFEDGLRETVAWYRQNTAWLDRTCSGEYREYFDRHYNRRKETLAGTAGK